MTNRVQSLRSSTPGQRPPNTRPPGEIYTNWSDRQIGVMDSTSTPMDMVAIRFFSAAANYAVGDFVVQGGQLYRCITPVTPGAFNPAQWRQSEAGVAPINNPVFTGDPQAPTPVSTDNDTSIATTAFVKTALGAVTSAAIPVGMLAPFAGATAPTGWQMCYGQNLSRSTYSALFTAIGTTYGNGDGSTTFGVPDLRGRVAAGKDDMGGIAANRLTTAGGGIAGNTLGAAGGAQSMVIGATNLPAHTHGFGTLVNSNDSPDHVHNVNGIPTGNENANHQHGPNDGGQWHSNQVSGASASGSGAMIGNSSCSSQNAVHQHLLQNYNTNGASARHSHTISGATDSGPGTGTAMPNPPPTQIFNYIIYAGA